MSESPSEWCQPPPPGWEVIAGGSTARLEKELGNDEQVVKVQYPDCPDPDLTSKELEREFDIYQTLPHHPRLLHLLPGSSAKRLILPYLPHGTLDTRLRSDAKPLSERQRLQIAADAAEAVAVLHAYEVFHGDIQLRNFMLDHQERLRVIDFAGSTMGGQQGTAIEGARYFLPRNPEEPSTARTDLFALGSVLYAILHGQELYAGKSEDEISELLQSHNYPSTADIVGGEVIADCWEGRCPTAETAFRALCEKLKCHDDSELAASTEQKQSNIRLADTITDDLDILSSF